MCVCCWPTRKKAGREDIGDQFGGRGSKRSWEEEEVDKEPQLDSQNLLFLLLAVLLLVVVNFD